MGKKASEIANLGGGMRLHDNANPENIAKANEIIAVLKQHPDGISRIELARAVNITSTKLAALLNNLLKDEPVGYDGSISGLVYWVGL